MTTNWHTAISVGAIANAATFNTPLGALDEAITNAQSGVYNVLEYGATGDGLTNDTTTIQAAFTAVSAAGGGIVYFPEGTYSVTGIAATVNNPYGAGTVTCGFKLASDTKVLLDAGATIKVATNSSQFYSVFVLDGVSNVVIQGGTLEGDADTHTDSPAGEWGYGIWSLSSSNVLIHNVGVTKFHGDGIHIGYGEAGTGGSNVTIRDCICDDNVRNNISVTGGDNILVTGCTLTGASGKSPEAGIDVEQEVAGATGAITNLTISDCLASDNDGNGIYVQGINVTETAVIGCKAHSNGVHGICVAVASPDYIYNPVVIGCHANENTECGIQIARARYGKVSGCHCEANGTHGIELYNGSTECLITGNTVVGNSQTTDVTYNGINVTGGDSNLIANNRVYEGADTNKQFIGINISAGDANRVLGNDVTDAGSSTAVFINIAVAATNSEVRDNLGYRTRNSGAAASTADGGTIAHSLAIAPIRATVSPSTAGEMATVTSLDATNITVAIKKHDNSAGTTQTIYWEAEA